MDNNALRLGLPETYRQTYVDLLVVDPRELMIYWDLSNEDRSGEKLLRLYENSKLFADVFVGNSDNWHLGASPLNFYQVELISITQGKEKVLAKSKNLRTPPDTFSTVDNEEWLEITGWLRKYFLFLSKRLSFSSFFRKRNIREEWLLKEYLLKKKISPHESSNFMRKK
jgi:hypothetical protein